MCSVIEGVGLVRGDFMLCTERACIDWPNSSALHPDNLNARSLLLLPCEFTLFVCDLTHEVLGRYCVGVGLDWYLCLAYGQATVSGNGVTLLLFIHSSYQI